MAVLWRGEGRALNAVLAGLARADCIAITTECGLQNAALGIFIAASVLQAPGMTIASVSYALLMNLSAMASIFLMRRRGVQWWVCQGFGLGPEARSCA